MASFDREVLADETGVRAVWNLYRRGQWGPLSDFGLERSEVEDRFLQFENDHVVGERLTKTQCTALAHAIPEVGAASVELRLAYALQFHAEAMRAARSESAAEERIT